MTSKSKSKGNSFERDIRDLLNKAFESEEFARTPNSGAIMGRSNFEKNKNLHKDTKTTLGSDLICPPWFRFSVECKSYKDSPNYAQIIKGDDKKLDHWLGEALFDSINLNLTPLLCFKTTRKGTHIALPYHFRDVIMHSCSHALQYNEFLIIGVEHFERIVRVLNALNNDNEVFDAVQMWMKDSLYVNRLITEL